MTRNEPRYGCLIRAYDSICSVGVVGRYEREKEGNRVKERERERCRERENNRKIHLEKILSIIFKK